MSSLPFSPAGKLPYDPQSHLLPPCQRPVEPRKETRFLGAPPLRAWFVLLCDPEAAGITCTCPPRSLCLFEGGDSPFENVLEAIGPSPPHKTHGHVTFWVQFQGAHMLPEDHLCTRSEEPPWTYQRTGAT